MPTERLSMRKIQEVLRLKAGVQAAHHYEPDLNPSYADLAAHYAYGTDRLEAACRRALTIGGFSDKSVDSILKRGLDQQPLPDPTQSTESAPPPHANLRGPAYYH